MNAFTTASIVFVTLFGATLLGMRLRAALPEHHLAPDAKDAVKVGMASVATMAALVLGLLVASTKSAYDAERNEVIQMAAKIDYLDGVLANYGPEAKACRDMLRGAVERAIVRMWPGQDSQHAQLDPAVSWTDALPNAIYKLAPESDVQRALKSQAVQLINELGQMRWLLYEQDGKLDLHAPVGRRRLLACDYVHQCGPVRAAELHGDCRAHAGGDVSGGRDLPHSRTGHAV